MCWSRSIRSATVRTDIGIRDLSADQATVGIYTDQLLHSYQGKNRLEVGAYFGRELPRSNVFRCHRMCSPSPSPRIIT